LGEAVFFLDLEVEYFPINPKVLNNDIGFMSMKMPCQDRGASKKYIFKGGTEHEHGSPVFRRGPVWSAKTVKSDRSAMPMQNPKKAPCIAKYIKSPFSSPYKGKGMC
jgi:hypothetical protein